MTEEVKIAKEMPQEEQKVEPVVGPLFTMDDIKVVVCADLQRAKKQLNSNKKFVKNCNRAMTNVRMTKNLAQLAKVVGHFGMIKYLGNASRHMIGVLNANQACPHDEVEVLMKESQVYVVKCSKCGMIIEHTEKEYVPESPEGEVVGTFTIGKK